jgi:uncharacterized protein (DUF1778 family)
MESKETAVITFRVSPEEFQIIEAKASEAGINRTDYVRARVLAPDNAPRIAELEKQVHELCDRLEKEAERQVARKCSKPEHAQLFGVGHCFICDVPMESRH